MGAPTRTKGAHGAQDYARRIVAAARDNLALGSASGTGLTRHRLADRPPTTHYLLLSERSLSEIVLEKARA